jgi:hypothetical protein
MDVNATATGWDKISNAYAELSDKIDLSWRSLEDADAFLSRRSADDINEPKYGAKSYLIVKP